MNQPQAYAVADAQEKARARVTADMTMGDIVKQFPAAIPVIQSAGLHCVGCHVAYWETLSDGCKAHGMSEEDVQHLLEKINHAISQPSPSVPLSVSSPAVAKLKELLSRENKVGWGLRVRVVKGGCAGNAYEMDFEEKKRADDTVVTEGGLSFFISPDSLPLVTGARIDYFDGLKGAGFSIRNPNAQATCGCGSSFA